MISASILGVTLTVLKIIGFVLLGLLALALLIAAGILFVPIRYKAKLRADMEGDNKSFHGFARASWLLHILNYTIQIDGKDMKTTFRILGIPIKRKHKDKASKGDDDYDLSTEEEIAEIEKELKFEPIVSRKVYVEDDEIIDIISEDKKSNSDILDEIYDEIEEDKNSPLIDESQNEAVKKEGFFSKIKSKVKKFIDIIKKVINLIRSIPRKIIGVITKVRDGISLGQEKLNKLEDFINDKENREAFEFAKKETKFLIKHIKPTKIVGEIEFGFDDPSWTGRLIGIYYSIFPVSPKKFRVTADFNKACFRGDMMMRGHIRLNHVLISYLRIKKNDRIVKLLNKI